MIPSGINSPPVELSNHDNSKNVDIDKRGNSAIWLRREEHIHGHLGHGFPSRITKSWWRPSKFCSEDLKFATRKPRCSPQLFIKEIFIALEAQDLQPRIIATIVCVFILILAIILSVFWFTVLVTSFDICLQFLLTFDLYPSDMTVVGYGKWPA